MATDEERIARVMTQAEGVHPEHPCQGLGKLIPKGETWPAWKVRLPQARAAISEMRAIEREKAEESVESDEFDNYVANARYGREYLTKSGT